MDPQLLLAVLLMVLGLGLATMEVFVPSGGILGVVAGLSLLASIVLAFMSDTSWGVGFTVAIPVALIACLATAFKFLPNTPMGRRILLSVPTSEEVLPDDAERRWMKQLVGQVGRAKTPMLPAGAVEIDGQTVSAITTGMAVEAGQLVRVVETRGNRIVVRPVEDEAPTEPGQGDLARPIETVGLDPFEEPLA
jgi:membrane-bound ClpP family serine protease